MRRISCIFSKEFNTFFMSINRRIASGGHFISNPFTANRHFCNSPYALRIFDGLTGFSAELQSERITFRGCMAGQIGCVGLSNNIQQCFKHVTTNFPSSWACPISLLPIGYKLCSSRTRHAQLSFRAGRGTAGTFVVAKRLVEFALHVGKNGKLISSVLGDGWIESL